MPGPRRQKKRRGNKPGLASKADRFDLYQRAVQSPEADVEFFVERFRGLRGREPMSLREDFCGTALLATTWLAGDPERTALAVDLDREPLDWGLEHNASDESLRARLEIRCADVLEVDAPRVDLACAMNFSYCTFKTRDQLRRYFSTVHAGLTDDGVFVCELYGGTEAVTEFEEERDVDDFVFVWEQESFNPIDHRTVCHIHFAFRDGSTLEKAFTYDWRLWSIPEVLELLIEAGFETANVYWEETDEDGDGTGHHHLATVEENQEGWLVYVVAGR